MMHRRSARTKMSTPADVLDADQAGAAATTEDAVQGDPPEEGDTKLLDTTSFELLSIDEAAHFLRGNRFIVAAYRPLLTLRVCARSAFMLHNETWNTWTHVVACAAFIALIAYSQTEIMTPGTPLLDRVALLLFLVSCVFCFAISSVYHLFSCHTHSAFRCLSQADFIGISVAIAGSLIPGVYFGLVCYPFWKWVHMGVMSLGFVAGLVYLVFPSLTNGFSATAKGLSSYGWVPVLQWVFFRGITSYEILHFFPIMFVSYVFLGIGLFFYLTCIPERWFPGHFTSVWQVLLSRAFLSGRESHISQLHSHILWHVFVALGCAWMYVSGQQYYLYSRNGEHC